MNGLTPYASWMAIIFAVGYLLIALEHIVKINKTSIALLMAVICWTLQFFNQGHSSDGLEVLTYHLGEISQIVFFLMGALAIVEIISTHQGFKVIANLIQVSSKRKLLWIVGFVTFFLSSVLDNLTTTIVLISLLSKLLPKSEERLLIGGGVVIAANAGGVWTPIGDVTTTMLWIGGQLTPLRMIQDLFWPSFICFIVSFLLISRKLKGNFAVSSSESNQNTNSERLGNTIFFLGIGSLVFVPIFKAITSLPPFMGIFFGLSVLWIITDLIHRKYEDRDHLKVPSVLGRIDLSSTLFFLGILMAITALDAALLLSKLAGWLDSHVGNPTFIATFIGLASAVIDNVPLVAASMGMYDLAQHPLDSQFWQLIAYCAGTGGSILIIGSPAGVVFMGLEKVDFFWYLKHIAFSALVGYFAGIGVYLLWAAFF